MKLIKLLLQLALIMPLIHLIAGVKISHWHVLQDDGDENLQCADDEVKVQHSEYTCERRCDPDDLEDEDCVRITPTAAPSTASPTDQPTNPPTNRPTNPPSHPPTNPPSHPPTNPPTPSPTPLPTHVPSDPPTNAPTFPPTAAPTVRCTGTKTVSGAAIATDNFLTLTGLLSGFPVFNGLVRGPNGSWEMKHNNGVIFKQGVQSMTLRFAYNQRGVAVIAKGCDGVDQTFVYKDDLVGLNTAGETTFTISRGWNQPLFCSFRFFTPHPHKAAAGRNGLMTVTYNC